MPILNLLIAASLAIELKYCHFKPIGRIQRWIPRQKFSKKILVKEGNHTSPKSIRKSNFTLLIESAYSFA